MVSINEKNCIGCGVCLVICPEDAITLYAGKAQIAPLRCTDCGQCISVCPRNAITKTVVSEIDELKKRMEDIKKRVALLSKNVDYLTLKK